MRLGTNKQRKEDGRRWLLKYANGVSGPRNSPPNARNERTLTERSGDDSPKGLLSRREGKSMGKEGNIYFQGRESIHEESR